MICVVIGFHVISIELHIVGLLCYHKGQETLYSFIFACASIFVVFHRQSSHWDATAPLSVSYCDSLVLVSFVNH